MLVKKPTQAQKILKALKDANGSWINGQYFLRTMFISQYHARIFQLQKEGEKIEASNFKDRFGFKGVFITTLVVDTVN